MKILHTADWHIGQFKGPVVDGVNLRSQDTVKCLEYMVQVAIEEKPDIVCVSGDIFHQEQVGPVRYSDEMITATNIITSLAHFSKYVIVMRGTPNHDGAAQFRVLERMLLNIRNVDVVTEPGVIKTPWADIACLPGFDKQEFRAKFPGLSADEENLAWTKYISDYGLFTIPMSKAMLFRTESVKDNPEGRSILRNAYRSWYFKRRIQEIEAIGIERDLAGLPVIHAPEDLEIWDSQDPDMVKINGALIAMVKNLRRNESEGLVLPHGYEAELLSTGGTRQFDTNAIINRYDTKIAQTVLADFIMLGHEKTGSFALSSDKTELFSVALGAFLDVICETFNNQGIPSLIDINGSHFDGIEDYPTLAHGDVDKRDITKLSTFLKDMVGTGILIPDEELEDYVREAANLPERTEVPDSREKDERREAQRRAPEKTANEPDGPEVDPEENQDAEEAKKRLGR